MKFAQGFVEHPIGRFLEDWSEKRLGACGPYPGDPVEKSDDKMSDRFTIYCALTHFVLFDGSHDSNLWPYDKGEVLVPSIVVEMGDIVCWYKEYCAQKLSIPWSSPRSRTTDNYCDLIEKMLNDHLGTGCIPGIDDQFQVWSIDSHFTMVHDTHLGHKVQLPKRLLMFPKFWFFNWYFQQIQKKDQRDNSWSIWKAQWGGLTCVFDDWP